MMTLQRELYDRYWDQGWLVVEGVYTADEAEALAAFATEVAEQELAGHGVGIMVESSSDGDRAPRKIGTPFTRDQRFRDFVLNPRLQAMVHDLLGKPPLLATDQIFMKPPHFGSAKPYHQDNYYFECTPGDEVVTAWIALDDVAEENGCLRYISGSHKGPILPHAPIPGEEHNLAVALDQVDLSREALAEVKKGGVVFHHSETLHTSHRNESANWRRAYATHWVTADVTSTTPVLDDAHFRRPDYPVDGPCILPRTGSG